MTEPDKLISLEQMAEDLRNRKWYHDAWWWVRYGVWQWLEERPRAIRWFFQRGRRGWADLDSWNFHAYVAGVIAGAVDHLGEIAHGYPARFHRELNRSHVLGSVSETGEISPEQADANQIRWNEILGDISFAFRAAKQIGDDRWYSPDSGWSSDPGGWTDAWYAQWTARAEEDKRKFDQQDQKALTKEEYERYERGWRYFREYFYDLWD